MSDGRLEEMIRVDHAGEHGAVRIYDGQLAVFDKIPGFEKTADLVRHMAEQEQEHLDHFDALIVERNIRPTAFGPVWNVAGFALGAVTALMGEKAAMACTAAVETEIDAHYAAQLDELEDGADDDLRDTIEKFRADEARDILNCRSHIRKEHVPEKRFKDCHLINHVLQIERL